jgi:hypothetical protein
MHDTGTLELGGQTRREAQQCAANKSWYTLDTLGDPCDNVSDSSPAPANLNTRRARSETALKQITSLQARRIQPGGLARGNFPSGQVARRSPREQTPATSGASPTAAGEGDARPAGPRMAKFSARPTTTHGSSPPDGGKMVRAPGALRISRNATVGSMRGPNLGGRSANRGGSKGDKGPGGQEQGPKKRQKTDDGEKDSRPTSVFDMDPATTMSDGMVQHLLRLQRKEWDRVPYEPKYTQGSFAANELIHEGRELFRGEAPPVKYWGRLEKRIGVVGMFGAEAHLKVRRVPDGDEAPFGQEDMEKTDLTKETAVQ